MSYKKVEKEKLAVTTNDRISEEQKWNAVINCDKAYDGLFYYAVKTTGIFCRPSCRAKAPLKVNTLFFETAEEALEEGFRPCKMCRPDLVHTTYEPNKELIQKTKDFLAEKYNDLNCVKTVAKALGISTSHLNRIFKQYCEVTPNEYLLEIRISKAQELLESTEIGILDIAYETGFGSMSTFYKCFKVKTGITPKEYRNKIE